MLIKWLASTNVWDFFPLLFKGVITKLYTASLQETREIITAVTSVPRSSLKYLVLHLPAEDLQMIWTQSKFSSWVVPAYVKGAVWEASLPSSKGCGAGQRIKLFWHSLPFCCIKLKSQPIESSLSQLSGWAISGLQAICSPWGPPTWPAGSPQSPMSFWPVRDGWIPGSPVTTRRKLQTELEQSLL